MAIHLDRSTASGILVKCSSCPHWHAFAWTIAKAWDAGRRHEILSHGSLSASTRKASDSAAQRARHAE